MNQYVEIGYPIYEGMPVYPGLPDVTTRLRDDMNNGADWNGSVLSIYLHAGTHVDAPWHYMGENAPTIDKIPTERFVYNHPLLVDVPAVKPNDLITIEQIKAYENELEQADFIIFNTHFGEKRDIDFEGYSNSFPTLAPETAEWIRRNLPNLKAVAIDTLSIENLSLGKENGYRTHKALLDPSINYNYVLVYEDINPMPLIGKTLKRAFCTPLRILGRDASIVNIFVEVEA
ncbi:MAG TPA: cyclase family protein [Ruminiclostridium sp.]|nr:cyclase family protein [Ruminiclostridium sp.]